MRQVALASFILLLVTAEAPAQNWADKLFDNKTIHDFGTVARGAQLTHKFVIKNRWAVPLEITSIYPTCNCVTVKESKRVLKPLETGYIEVNMDGRRFTGSKSVTIRVSVGPEYISTAELRVSAFSRADVVFNPGEVNFGTVQAGQEAKQGLDIEYAGGLEWAATEVLSKGLPVETSLKELYRRPGQVGYRLEVTLKDSAPAGNLKQELYLKTNDPASPLLPILLEATVQASVAVSPAQLTLGEIKVGEPILRSVAVRGNRPFVVTNVDGVQRGLLEVAGGVGGEKSKVQIVKFKCVPNQAGEFKRTLRIVTDAQDSPVAVTISGIATE